MSKERLYKTLLRFGLSRTDIKVYISLAKKGPQKGKDLCTSLHMQKQQLYPALKSLTSKGFVIAACKPRLLFSAIPFEKVLKLIIKVNIEEAEDMKQNKEKILSNWKTMKLDSLEP